MWIQSKKRLSRVTRLLEKFVFKKTLSEQLANVEDQMQELHGKSVSESVRSVQPSYLNRMQAVWLYKPNSQDLSRENKHANNQDLNQRPVHK